MDLARPCWTADLGFWILRLDRTWAGLPLEFHERNPASLIEHAKPSFAKIRKKHDSPARAVLDFGFLDVGDYGLWIFWNLGFLEFGISGRGELSGALGSGILESGIWISRLSEICFRVRVRVKLGP